MVLVPVEEGGGPGGSGGSRSGLEEHRSQQVHRRVSLPHRSCPSLIPSHRAPPEEDTAVRGSVGCAGGWWKVITSL